MFNIRKIQEQIISYSIAAVSNAEIAEAIVYGENGEAASEDNDTWCQCSAGYSKVLFERAFQCNVEVALLKSVKMGDDICLMKIIPDAPVWR